MMTLFGYWRSSASWRVRIGLALKGVTVAHSPVDLRGGAHRDAAHRERNSMAQVPVLEWESGGETHRLSQSLAILSYIDALYPDPPLLPSDPLKRARVLELSEIINSGIHPLQNLSTQKRVAGISETSGPVWARLWIEEGMTSLEAKAQLEPGPFLVGDSPTLADCCLIPQLYNARRFDCEVSAWPRLLATEQACLDLPSFFYTHPDRHTAPGQDVGTNGAPNVSDISRHHSA